MDTQVAAVLALSFGALTVETVNVVLRRRARPAVSCDRLHRIAVMELLRAVGADIDRDLAVERS